MIIYASVLEINGNQLLVLDHATQQEIAVNLRCGCNFRVNDNVKIIYDGIMTMSIPPQISVRRIIKINAVSAIPYLAEYSRILNNMINNMTSAETTDSISHNFIVRMIPHHQAAIEMSENVLKFTTNAELTEIANNIIAEQTRSIENMQEILNTCSCLENSECELRNYQRNISGIMMTMFADMSNAYSNNCIDCNFIREMIPHHEGAVRMSENTLKFNICPELKPILNSIIVSQKRGIRQMRNLYRRLKCR